MKQLGVNFADSLQENGFAAYAVESRDHSMQFCGRNRYRKIVLVSGEGEINYDGRVYGVKGAALLICQPGVHCTWTLAKTMQSSYVCAFNEDFNDDCDMHWKTKCDNYFSLHPVFALEAAEERFIRTIFCRLTDQQVGTYQFKLELAQNKICVMTHLALKMAPTKRQTKLALKSYSHGSVSLELVELRFPSVAQVLHLN